MTRVLHSVLDLAIVFAASQSVYIIQCMSKACAVCQKQPGYLLHKHRSIQTYIQYNFSSTVHNCTLTLGMHGSRHTAQFQCSCLYGSLYTVYYWKWWGEP